MKKPKQKKPTIIDLEKEKDYLYVTKSNPTRLKEIINKLDWIYYGIKN
jgi:hypothetical protein